MTPTTGYRIDRDEDLENHCPRCGTDSAHHPACPEGHAEAQLAQGPPIEEADPAPGCCDLGVIPDGPDDGQLCPDCYDRRGATA